MDIHYCVLPPFAFLFLVFLIVLQFQVLFLPLRPLGRLKVSEFPRLLLIEANCTADSALTFPRRCLILLLHRSFHQIVRLDAVVGLCLLWLNFLAPIELLVDIKDSN